MTNQRIKHRLAGAAAPLHGPSAARRTGIGKPGMGTRRRRWLQRLALVALVGLVTTLGTTGCNPLYYYYNHGPPDPPATPSGTYNMLVTAQSSNGITAITNSTTMVLTVN